ncbi:MAG: hypothetical protein OER85_14950, partial [Gammaproteobacteria bacterium]|nr:hypothetical protein [Gammaproteobacteria bacterium]
MANSIAITGNWFSIVVGVLRESAVHDDAVRATVVLCHHVAMKAALFSVPVILSLVMLGAHFMRYGNSIGVIGSLALIALLVVNRPWVARLIQIVLILGALEWLRTLYELVEVRAAHGQPVTRMIVILGAVAAVTFCSALLFQTTTLKQIYGLDR